MQNFLKGQVKLLGPRQAAAQAESIIARAQRRFKQPRHVIGLALARAIREERREPAPAFSPKVRRMILSGRRPRATV